MKNTLLVIVINSSAKYVIWLCLVVYSNCKLEENACKVANF